MSDKTKEMTGFAKKQNTALPVPPIPLTVKPGKTIDVVPVGNGSAATPITASKTVCVKTFGCQMNVHDSDRMRRMVRDAGYAEVDRYEDADLVILNTCYVRENAVDRVRGHL